MSEKMKNKTDTKKENKQDSNEAAELKDLLQRKQAELENYRKQTEKRVEEIEKTAAKSIINQVLPIMDNFGLALQNQQNCASADLIKGVELIYTQISKVLEDNGVKLITTNEQFDPYFHEALLKVDSDQPENTILEVLQNGYTLQGQVIRHARVKISSGKKENIDNKPNLEENKNDN